MKYRILAVIVILLALFSINISAASYEYHISPGADFTSVQYGDDLTEISKKLNMTTDELNTYFNQNGLLYLAISDDTKTQIRLSAFTDNFSSTVSDIAYLDNQQLNEFMNAVSDTDDSAVCVLSNNERKYIQVKNTLKDSGGIYTVTQYITICNNKTFYVSCYNEGNDTSAEVQAAFESLYLNETSPPQTDYTLPIILTVVGIVVFSAIAIIMIIGIIRLNTKKSCFKENTKNEI